VCKSSSGFKKAPEQKHRVAMTNANKNNHKKCDFAPFSISFCAAAVCRGTRRKTNAKAAAGSFISINKHNRAHDNSKQIGPT
jgi:hypothetical protein